MKKIHSATDQKSPAWKYFGNSSEIFCDDPSKAICSLRKVIISSGTGHSKKFTTTTLNIHLNYKHDDEYKAMHSKHDATPVESPSAKTKTQESLSNITSKETPWDIDSLEAHRVTVQEAIGDLIAIDNTRYTAVLHR